MWIKFIRRGERLIFPCRQPARQAGDSAAISCQRGDKRTINDPISRDDSRLTAGAIGIWFVMVAGAVYMVALI